MISLQVKEGEPIEKALKRFKKKADRANILRTYRSHTSFMKPSTRRRNVRLRAIYRQQMMRKYTLM